MRDRLSALVLAGKKVATASLWQEGYVDEGEVLDAVGERQVLLGNEDEPLAVIEVTRVERVPFAEVTWELAEAEGEGFTSVEDWRERHRAFYARGGSRSATTPSSSASGSASSPTHTRPPSASPDQARSAGEGSKALATVREEVHTEGRRTADNEESGSWTRRA